MNPVESCAADAEGGSSGGQFVQRQSSLRSKSTLADQLEESPQTGAVNDCIGRRFAQTPGRPGSNHRQKPLPGGRGDRRPCLSKAQAVNKLSPSLGARKTDYEHFRRLGAGVQGTVLVFRVEVKVVSGVQASAQATVQKQNVHAAAQDKEQFVPRVPMSVRVAVALKAKMNHRYGTGAGKTSVGCSIGCPAPVASLAFLSYDKEALKPLHETDVIGRLAEERIYQ
jgi:hypothetical protein